MMLQTCIITRDDKNISKIYKLTLEPFSFVYFSSSQSSSIHPYLYSTPPLTEKKYLILRIYQFWYQKDPKQAN